MSAPASGQKVEWHDVQGLVLRGYGKHPYSANLLLQIDDSALVRKWLLSVSHRVTTSERAKNEIDHCYFNLAFTRSGLEKLELMQDWLAVFPASFLEGMDSENRSRILGDEKQSDPQNWEWGGPKTGVDVLVMIFGKDEDTLNHAIAAEQANLKGLSVKNDIRSQLWPDEKEHFGFHDGISQPVIESSPPPSHHQQNNHADGEYAPHNVIKAGEFVLGYKNEYGVLADPLNLPIDADPRQILFTVPMRDGSIAPDLGRNGTFLIVRQIRQHVAEFRSYLEQVGQTVQEREQIAAKIIGRWKSGAPLVTSPDKDDPNRCEQNEFLYHAIDPDGMRCPFGAHVRRANPRDMLGNDPKDGLTILKRHRLIRRGRSYGPRLADELDDKDDNELEDKADRGLLFMAINANIERQFEFIQQTWLRGVSFGGLYAEMDPVGSLDGTKQGSMTIPHLPVRQRLQGLGGFVTICGGAYFFMPSIRALQYLATFKNIPERTPKPISQAKPRVAKKGMSGASRVLMVLAAIILLALLARWWMHINVSPPPPTATTPPFTLPSTVSHLSLVLNCPKSAIQSQLENAIPQSLSFDNTSDGARVYGTTSRGPIAVAIDGNAKRISFTTAMSGHAQFEKRVVIDLLIKKIDQLFSQGFDFAAHGTASFSPVVAPNWSVDPQLTFDAEADRIVVKLPWPLGDLDVSGIVKNGIANALNGVKQTANDKVKELLQFHTKVESIWNKINLVNEVSTTPPTWLRITPQKASVGQFDYSGDTLNLGISLDLEIHFFLQEVAPSLTQSPLPDLQVNSPLSDEFSLAVPIEISYSLINQELNAQLKKDSISLPQGVTVKISNADIHRYGDGILLTLDFSASKGMFKSASGRLYFTGIPVVDADKSELRLDELNYSVATKDILIKSIDWIAHETLLDLLKKTTTIQLTSELAKAKTEANNQLIEFAKHLPPEIGASVSISTINIAGVAFDDQRTFVLVTVKGKMSAKLNP